MDNKSFGYQQAVLKTLRYFSQFDYPLDFQQLWWRLPIKISSTQLKQILVQLQKKKKIICQNNWYCLVKQKQLIKIRQHRQIISKAKKQQAQDFLKFAQNFSLIKAVAITGSLAADNATEQDDLDFLVLTQKNCLWLVRAVVLLYSCLKKRRPQPGININNAWDFNLWLAEDQLTMTTDRQSVYEAYEILQIDWLLDKAQIKTQLWQKNFWLKKFLPNYAAPKFSSPVLKQNNLILLTLLNYLFYLGQKYYRQLRYGSQTVNLNQAFFHSTNNKNLILKNRWKK